MWSMCVDVSVFPAQSFLKPNNALRPAKQLWIRQNDWRFWRSKILCCRLSRLTWIGNLLVVIHRRRGGAYSFVADLSHLTIGHASRSRRSTVPTPNRDTSITRALITLFRCITYSSFFCESYPLSVWPSVATIYLLG